MNPVTKVPSYKSKFCCMNETLIMASEIMVATPAIRALIRDDKIHQIYSAMQSGKKHGMHTMNDSLYQLYLQRDVTMEDALRCSPDPSALMRAAGQTPMEEQDLMIIDEKQSRPAYR